MATEYQQVGTEVKYREETNTYEQDLGYETVSVCKPKFIFFEMVGLRPSTPHWIFFDGIEVTKWVNTSFNLDSYNNAPINSLLRNPGDNYITATSFPTAQGGPTNASGPINTDASGTLSGAFYLQSNDTLSFKTGTKKLTAIDVSILDKQKALSYAEGQFVSTGIYEVYYEQSVTTNVAYDAPIYDWVTVPDPVSPANSSDDNDRGSNEPTFLSHYEPSTGIVTTFNEPLTHAQIQELRQQGTETTTNIFGQKTAAFSGNNDGGSSGGKSNKQSDKILCNYIYELGYLDKDVWILDEQFGDIVASEDPVLLEGYHAWAEPMIEWMKAGSILSKIYLHAWVIPFTRCWAQHIAHVMEPTKHKDNFAGKLMYNIGVPLSRFIGKHLTNTKMEMRKQ